MDENIVNQFLPISGNFCDRVFWVGIGCNSKTEHLLIEMAIEHIFVEHQLLSSAMPRATIFDGIAGFATIENKAALIEFCRSRNLPLKTFSAEVLQNVIVPHPSQVVKDKVGTPSVAEAAAILACRAEEDACVQGFPPVEQSIRSQSRKEVSNCNLIVPKQIFRAQGLSGAVTIAVAI